MIIKVKVNTRAAVNEVIKAESDVYNYIVRTNTAPVNGKANTKVVELLADYFKIAKNSVTIIKGIKSNLKTIQIDG